MFKITLSLISLFICSITNAQGIFNGDFEKLDPKGIPAGWDLTYDHINKYDVRIDSAIKRQGRYAIAMASTAGTGSGAIKFTIDKAFRGKSLTLAGYIKTENVTDGFAGLWLRLRGTDGAQLAFETMETQKLTGTNDWKEYKVHVNYNDDEATEIIAGAMLVGKGKIWVDDLRLIVDDTPIDEAQLKQSKYKATTDHEFENGSGIDTIIFNKTNPGYLDLLGELWGFLKYYHPSVAKGDYNWDAELFRIMPQIRTAKTDAAASDLFEKWVAGLGDIPACKDCKSVELNKKLALRPNYGTLFSNATFSQSLKKRLTYIINNSNNQSNYYVSNADVSNPQFTHEKLDDAMKYPDVGYRLLALFRYWNIIHYFSPDRELITEDWNKVLPAFIPQLIAAKDKNDYVNTMVRLICTTHDSHSFIGSNVYENTLGKYRLPAQAKFISGKLVVTGYYKDTMNVKQQLKIGDVLQSIDGISVKDLVKKYSPFIPGSNQPVVLRDLPGTYLLRNDEPVFKLKISRDDRDLVVNQEAPDHNKIDAFKYDWDPVPNAPGFRLLNKDIGYIFCENYKVKDLELIKHQFKDTKGIIVDMRNYPTDEMEQSLSGYFKPDSSAFVKFTNGSISKPGTFNYSAPAMSGTKTGDYYKGKIVVLVNEYTQSNAEFVTMAIQTAPKVTVIGSTTAGADGNISAIPLPGRLSTYVSGLGVFYPDGTNAQRAGVKIDKVVKPTIAGIKSGRDELLEEAQKIIVK